MTSPFVSSLELSLTSQRGSSQSPSPKRPRMHFHEYFHEYESLCDEQYCGKSYLCILSLRETRFVSENFSWIPAVGCRATVLMDAIRRAAELVGCSDNFQVLVFTWELLCRFVVAAKSLGRPVCLAGKIDQRALAITCLSLSVDLVASLDEDWCAPLPCWAQLYHFEVEAVHDRGVTRDDAERIYGRSAELMDAKETVATVLNWNLKSTSVCDFCFCFLDRLRVFLREMRPGNFSMLAELVRDRGSMMERSVRALLVPCGFAFSMNMPSVTAAAILAIALSTHSSTPAAATPLRVAPSSQQQRGRILRKVCAERAIAAASELTGAGIWSGEIVHEPSLLLLIGNRYTLLDALGVVEILGRPADPSAGALGRINSGFCGLSV